MGAEPRLVSKALAGSTALELRRMYDFCVLMGDGGLNMPVVAWPLLVNLD